MRNDMRISSGRQDGVALAAGLMILLIITVIGVVSMRSSIFEIRMARNEEARMEAFQRAESLVESIVSYDANFNAVSAGDSTCLKFGDANCTITIDADLNTAPHNTRSTGSTTFICETTAPRFLAMSEGNNVFLFDVLATYDATSAKQGRASVALGVLDVANVGGAGSSTQAIMAESVAAGAAAGTCAA